MLFGAKESEVPLDELFGTFSLHLPMSIRVHCALHLMVSSPSCFVTKLAQRRFVTKQTFIHAPRLLLQTSLPT